MYSLHNKKQIDYTENENVINFKEVKKNQSKTEKDFAIVF